MRDFLLILCCCLSVIGFSTLVGIMLCIPNKEKKYEGINIKLHFIVIIGFVTGISMIGVWLLR